MPLIESLLLLLLLSRAIGEISEYFGQPAMIGEIVAGVLLGPSILGAVHYTSEIQVIAQLGVLLLVFIAGMEMDMEVLWKSFRGRGIWVGAAGFTFPMILGILVGLVFGMNTTRSVFIGLCIAITALPVSVRILMGLGKLQSETGQRIISAAVLNDVTALSILGVILDVKRKGGAPGAAFVSMGLALVKAVSFMAVVVVAARLIKRYSRERFVRSRNIASQLLGKLKGKESVFAIVLLFVMGFASFSEALGMHFVVGTFFGSMLLSHELVGKAKFLEIQKTATDITFGFLGPIFFAAIGLEFDAASLRNWGLVAAILAAAFAGKILGGYVGGRLANLTSPDSWAAGFGMNGRGIMELVIANVALSNGFIGQQLFTILVLMAVVTTFVTPLLLKWAFSRMPATTP
ncbi:MAG: cation:proton antiporter [Terriglobia bacterium]